MYNNMDILREKITLIVKVSMIFQSQFMNQMEILLDSLMVLVRIITKFCSQNSHIPRKFGRGKLKKFSKFSLFSKFKRRLYSYLFNNFLQSVE